MSTRSLFAGASLAVGARALLARLLRAKFARDVRRLNVGDYAGLLDAYADDAVVRFCVGDHRFAGEWVGREQIERFLRNFTAAGLQGEIKSMAMSGPPWSMTLWARFDDHASGADGTRIYANRTALVLRTRWGKIVEHEDFYADTAPIAEFERQLTARGIAPLPKSD